MSKEHAADRRRSVAGLLSLGLDRFGGNRPLSRGGNLRANVRLFNKTKPLEPLDGKPIERDTGGIWQY